MIGYTPVAKAKLRELAADPVVGHLQPIISAAASHGVMVGTYPCGSRPIQVPQSGRPWVFVIGDDLGEPSKGPAGFDRVTITEALSQATAIAVHSGEPMPAVYATAAALAAAGGRVVIVETQIGRHAEWAALARKAGPDAAHLDVMPKGGRA